MLRLLDAEIVRFFGDEQRILSEHPRFGIRDIRGVKAIGTPGQISIDEARFLGELVRRADRHRPIIEIGTLFGYSTRVIAMNKPWDQLLITVDNYSWNPLGLSPDAHTLATRLALQDAIVSQHTRVLAMNKDEFYATYSGPQPALFFCDADHSYEATRADLEWARRVGADIICGDDYDGTLYPGVTRAVDELGGPKALVDGLFVLSTR